MEFSDPPMSAFAPTPRPTVASAETPPYVPGQSAGGDRHRRRQHGPHDVGASGEPEVDAELVDGADVAILASAQALEHAVEILGRTEDEANAAGHLAAQDADFDVGRSSAGRTERGNDSEEQRGRGVGDWTHCAILRLKRIAAYALSSPSNC
jgi:hypothetical protein